MAYRQKKIRHSGAICNRYNSCCRASQSCLKRMKLRLQSCAELQSLRLLHQTSEQAPASCRLLELTFRIRRYYKYCIASLYCAERLMFIEEAEALSRQRESAAKGYHGLCVSGAQPDWFPDIHAGSICLFLLYQLL